MFTRVSAAIDRFIGLASQKTATIERIRAEQVRAIVRLTPAMMLGNIVCIGVIANEARGTSLFPVIILFGIGLLVLVLNAMGSWLKLVNKPRESRFSVRATQRTIVMAGMMGLFWGLIPVITLSFSHFDTHQNLVQTALLVAIAGGGAMALAPLPQAGIAFILPLIFGSSIMLAFQSNRTEQVMAGLEILYACVMIAAALAQARIFVAHLLSELEAVEQKSVVGLLLKSFEDNASDWLWQVDARGRFERASQRFSVVMGTPAEALNGTRALSLLRDRASRNGDNFNLAIAFRDRLPFRDLEICVHRSGVPRWWRISGEPIFDARGRFRGFRGVGSDITEARMAANRVSYLAHYDSLTGALNRAKFNEILAGKIARRARTGEAFALLYLDLDHFKAVNDTHGHQAGDALLAEVVRRLQSALSVSDLLARLGGDEFGIMVEGKHGEDTLMELAQRLLGLVAEPCQIDKTSVEIGASIGISLADEATISAEQLMHNADLALYQAKHAGRLTCRIFTPDMDRARREALILEAELAQAVTRNQLELHFQPFVHSQNDEIAGCEALLRWRHPERGMIPPFTFIPVAERTGLIGEIGLWVLGEACRIAATWPPHLTVAVNLSSRQFENPALASEVRQALEASGLEAHRLELEITESVLIERPEAVIDCLKELKAFGVKIAMDDFGTGYSSLSYLWRFPFDKIKIDGAFVAAITGDQAARQIVGAISGLAKEMGLCVTAERVETREEVEFLTRLQCDYFQGYFFSKPLPYADLAALLMQDLARKHARSHTKPDEAEARSGSFAA